MEFHSVKPTEADVRNVYRLLLGRAPKTDQAVTDWMASAPNVGLLVTRFLESDEFMRKHGHLFKKPRLIDTTKLGRLVEELASRHPQRELYQPVFGIDVDHGGPVQRECVHRCHMILKAFAELPTNNMTMLDVGCNMGYVTFYLADHFARVTGLEYDQLLFTYCIELAKILEKNVVFEQTDFFQNYASMRGQYDICLLFSVIHYLVANKGLEEAKLVLNSIVDCFDFTIIELSSATDYPYMPADPADMLSGLTNVDITFLGVSDKNLRPVYFIKKRSVEGGEHPLIEAALYVKPLPTSCSRVYFSERSVVKKLSANYQDNALKYTREVKLYTMLSESTFVPKFLGASWSAAGGLICCERKHGILLNHLYQLAPHTKFATTFGKEVLMCQLLLALRALARLGQYWNDLSAHNMMISEGALILFDFGETDSVELNDHVAMLSWVLHDLQLERPESYACGVYSAIHDAGANRKESRKYMFAAEKDFFDSSLSWLYAVVCSLDSIQDLLKIDDQTIRKIETAAAGRIELLIGNPGANSVDGIVNWTAIPAIAAGNAVFQTVDEPYGGACNSGEPLAELRIEILGRARSEQLDTSALDRTRVKGYLDTSEAGLLEPKQFSEQLLERANRAETYNAALLEELTRKSIVHADLMGLVERAEQASRGYAESLVDRANRAEAYNEALLEELTRKSIAHADLLGLLERTERASRGYAESLVERAKRAESYNAALLEELSLKSSALIEAKALSEQTEQSSKDYAASLLQRATQAELFIADLTERISLSTIESEHLRVKSRREAENHAQEIERLSALLEEARTYRALNWWQKLNADRKTQ